MNLIKPTDIVCYQRHADGTHVVGTVVTVYERGTPESLSALGVTLFAPAQLQREQRAYRLKLSEEDDKRVGHPVTLGHTRVLQAVRRHPMGGHTAFTTPGGTVYELIFDRRELSIDFLPLGAFLGVTEPEWACMHDRDFVRQKNPAGAL